MSFSRFEPLGEGLAISILIPLMEYADTLTQNDDRSSQGKLLWVLINDAKQRLEGTFAIVNAVKPDIQVEIKDIQ